MDISGDLHGQAVLSQRKEPLVPIWKYVGPGGLYAMEKKIFLSLSKIEPGSST
jgi:hypothetical protein